MTITQTVDIPASRRITIDVPQEVPTGKTILTFTPAKEADSVPRETPLPGAYAHTIEEALQMAAEKAANPNRKPISRHFGKLPKHTFGDPVEYQRAIRDEWD